jgi:hypothetical protein
MTPMMAGDMEIYSSQSDELPNGSEFLRPVYNFSKRVGWGIFVDERGDTWECGDKIIRQTPFVSFDATGKPRFGEAQNFSALAPFDSLQRVHSFPATDTLYLAGYTPDKKEGTWGIIGKVLARFEGWSKGNRQPTWTINLPHDFKPANGPRVLMKSMTITGDYLFIVGVDTRMKTLVYRLQDGRFVGTLNPGSEVGGNDNTGWVDMPEAISATARKNGEYLILIEEDARNKLAFYRWNPAR